jgi:hypothetical protein
VVLRVELVRAPERHVVASAECETATDFEAEPGVHVRDEVAGDHRDRARAHRDPAALAPRATTLAHRERVGLRLLVAGDAKEVLIGELLAALHRVPNRRGVNLRAVFIDRRRANLRAVRVDVLGLSDLLFVRGRPDLDVIDHGDRLAGRDDAALWTLTGHQTAAERGCGDNENETSAA